MDFVKMNQKNDKIAIYFVPGMAANSKIYERINLPKDKFECFFLEWIIPEANESIVSYAGRMCKEIKHRNPVLIGVSFGGILVQEMNRFLNVHKTIVISSVLHQDDYPFRMKFAKRTKLYKLIPTRILSDVEKIVKYAFGETVKGRVKLYEKYLSVSDDRYLKWAMKEIVNWEQNQQLENVIHIHGTKDKVFPTQYINDNFVPLENGTHVMIVYRYKWFNEHLPQLITA